MRLWEFYLHLGLSKFILAFLKTLIKVSLLLPETIVIPPLLFHPAELLLEQQVKNLKEASPKITVNWDLS